LAFLFVVVMFVGAILVLRTLDLTRGKLDAEEVLPISPVTLVEEPEDEARLGTVPEDLIGKEDD
jgi:hypothetical protein